MRRFATLSVLLKARFAMRSPYWIRPSCFRRMKILGYSRWESLLASIERIVDTPVAGIDASHRKVIFAASLGTVFEWYDFYLYGALAAIIAKQFFCTFAEKDGIFFKAKRQLQRVFIIPYSSCEL